MRRSIGRTVRRGWFDRLGGTSGRKAPSRSQTPAAPSRRPAGSKETAAPVWRISYVRAWARATCRAGRDTAALLYPSSGNADYAGEFPIAPTKIRDGRLLSVERGSVLPHLRSGQRRRPSRRLDARAQSRRRGPHPPRPSAIAAELGLLPIAKIIADLAIDNPAVRRYSLRRLTHPRCGTSLNGRLSHPASAPTRRSHDPDDRSIRRTVWGKLRAFSPQDLPAARDPDCRPARLPLPAVPLPSPH
jgi:hypothetical protein